MARRPPTKQCGEDCPLAARLRQRRCRRPAKIRSTAPTAVGFPAEYFLNPILDQGRFSGSVLSFRDISQRYALDRTEG